jgi:hypothetical protein
MIDMKATVKTSAAHRNYATYSFIFIILSLLLLSGCSTTGGHSNLTSQVISVDKELKVHLYNSIEELREAYMYAGGDIGKVKRVKGFYSDLSNTIHCMKWDYYTCGHELFHVLQYKGDHTLIAEKGYEHFKGTDFAASE